MNLRIDERITRFMGDIMDNGRLIRIEEQYTDYNLYVRGQGN